MHDKICALQKPIHSPSNCFSFQIKRICYFFFLEILWYLFDFEFNVVESICPDESCSFSPKGFLLFGTRYTVSRQEKKEKVNIL